MELSYCNPLSIEDIPEGRWLDAAIQKADLRKFKDYRSISDPSVIYYDGKWILYPSYSVAYVSEDFVHWKHVDIGIPNLTYSPAIAQHNDKWYLTGHQSPDLFVSDSPLGPFKLCGQITDPRGNIISTPDSCLFSDNGHLYIYWTGIGIDSVHVDCEYPIGTFAAELDAEKPWQMITEPVVINHFDPDQSWQRIGEYNQNERMGWIEGQWMIRIGKRYYLMYSGSGTEFSTYANAVLYSDEGPLSGFIPQKNHNPLATKRCGLLRGCGHGSIVQGPGNTLWMFYTSIFCYNHIYERRIGMDPLGIDENGELFCPAITETPQYAPGILPAPEKGNDLGLLPLTFMQPAAASSHEPGRDALYAVDDSILTWWQPKADDPDKTLTVTLGTLTSYDISAVRIIWRDIGMEILDGIIPGPFRYVLEYASSSDQARWIPLVDASENSDDLAIDYRTFPSVTAYAVRIRIIGAPKGITPALVSLTVFGKCHHSK